MPDRQCRDTGRYVARQISRLLRTDRSHGPDRAMLAELRRGVGAEAGSVPGIWSITIDGLNHPGSVDRPSRQETAAHMALTLFAVHQQSIEAPMHVAGTSFGAAIRRLIPADSPEQVHESPVYRRFTTMARAESIDALAYHARGLIGQLRASRIPFDYAAWADDLVQFQTPGGAAPVQRRWARDYFRVSEPDTSTSEDQPEE